MAVKKRRARARTYSSPVRQEQAERTRERIVEAAADLFVAEGYARATIRAIAERAGVAADTVYAVFGNKARVLTAVIDSRLAPAGEANVTDRPESLAVRDAPDQREQIRLFAREIASILGRVRPVYEILRTASSAEPAMAKVHAEMDGYRLQNMRRFVSWIAANGPLRVDDERASEIVWLLASPDVAGMLLNGLGWSTDQYIDWLEDMLIRSLLSDG